MILDYAYNRNKKVFSISYIKENGQKSLLNFNVSRFKAYYKIDSGKFMNWDGCACDVKWTDKPSNFEFKTYMKEMDVKYQQALLGKTAPKHKKIAKTAIESGKTESTDCKTESCTGNAL